MRAAVFAMERTVSLERRRAKLRLSGKAMRVMWAVIASVVVAMRGCDTQAGAPTAPQPDAPAPQSSQLTRAATNGRSSSTLGGRRVRKAGCSASAKARSPVDPWPGSARPVRTVQCLRASLASSRARRDLPTPASPRTTTIRPAPPSAASSPSRSARVCCSRPTSTGHSIELTAAYRIEACPVVFVPHQLSLRRK
jgi:hypothetical protein